VVYLKKKDIVTYNNTDTLAAIDLGLNNFATIVFYSYDTNKHIHPIIVSGKGLVSYNKHKFSKLDDLKSKAKTAFNAKTSKSIYNLNEARNRFSNDFYHKAAKKIVDELVKYEVSGLIIGYNKYWKQNTHLKTTQATRQFEIVSFNKFVSYLEDNCEYRGIKVKREYESHTSGTSFLDLEKADKSYYNKSRRKHRGSFVPNNTNFKPINADVNAAYQILAKGTGYTRMYNPKYITKESLIPYRVTNIDTFEYGKGRDKRKDRHNK
jgi:putative transposase